MPFRRVQQHWHPETPSPGEVLAIGVLMRKTLHLLLFVCIWQSAPPAYADGWQSMVDNCIATPLTLIGVVALVAGVVGIYFLPSVIGIAKQKENVVAICVLNFCLGLTFIGWLVSLLWALTNNGTERSNKEVAPSVIASYVGIFFLFSVPLLIVAKFYERSKESRNEYSTQNSQGFSQSNSSTSETSHSLGDDHVLFKDVRNETSALSSNTNTSIFSTGLPAAGSNSYFSNGTARYQGNNRDLAENSEDGLTGASQASQVSAELRSQLNAVEQRNSQAETSIRNLTKQVNVLIEQGRVQEGTIQELEKKLRISEQISESKDITVEDMRRTLEHWKRSSTVKVNAAFRSEEDKVTVENWPNVRDFRPTQYKGDVERRLNNERLNRRLSELGITTSVKIQFTIEKDGRPTNIQLLTPIDDAKTRKRCAEFIEAAGPFRPLLSDDLKTLTIEAALSQPADANLQLTSVQIEALGNKL